MTIGKEDMEIRHELVALNSSIFKLYLLENSVENDLYPLDHSIDNLYLLTISIIIFCMMMKPLKPFPP